MIKNLKDAYGNEAYPKTTFDSIKDDYGINLKDIVRTPFIKGINHRGYVDAPENTLPAYILSWKKGFRYVECDVSFTYDNIAVLLHDNTIDRTSNGTGNITSLTYEQLLQYDFGSWKSSAYIGTKIPTLYEFLILCRNLGIHPYIEIKASANYTDEQLHSIVDMVACCGLKGNITYISFSLPFLQSIRDYDKTARLGYLVSSINTNVIESTKGLSTGYNDVFLDSSKYGSPEIELCKNGGIPLEAWTINSKSTIKSLDDYISGVTSDSCNMENIRGMYAYFD